MFTYGAKVIEVVDGDTLKLDIDLGMRVHVQETVRLARINAPEMDTLAGIQAKAFVVDALAKASNITVSTSRSEKYGRWLVELNAVFAGSGPQTQNLSDLLLHSSHATRYP